MAFSKSFTDGCEMADDFPCSPCLKDNKHVEAVKFCSECKDYLCQTCLNYHAKFSSTAKHTVTDKSSVLVPKENVSEVDISYNSDVSPPNEVLGLCLVTRGTERYVILTDFRNKTVKLLALKSMKVISAVSLQNKPYGVCELPSSKYIVVTTRDAEVLVVLEFDGHTLAKVEKWFLKHTQVSRGMTAIKETYDDKLLVMDGAAKGTGKQPSLNVFASAVNPQTAWNVLYPIYTESLDTNSFSSNPRNVALSRDHKKLYITNELVGVVVTDVRGEKIGTLEDTSLRGARGICTDDDGNIYVTGVQSENVVKFSSEEKFIGEVVNSSHGLKSPVSLCYDGKSRSLIIGSADKIPVRMVKL